MSPDLLLPVITSIGWLILVGSALASHRLGWGPMVKMTLVWVAIFAGIFLVVEWFMIARDTASGLI
ncbi:hypothetical protein [Porphyrobacter sp. CACIAM 03H1]|jgi:hypothetical protein|uniref:hypothetical protein n=1 Tax=Porphyrobacter sp. CACIAM 03H1 TaxID=2003315 RepID=UPI000B5A2439|nr:hypothetical protein [Porphyrobacter sp. CACIAM 03H1]ASJ91345.1 hypothetical protein CBR61_10745 [Porphyrobacter sp. CACIAM 03H1]